MKNRAQHLGELYPLVDLDQAETTKQHILLEATILFAKNGYAGVSVRDIAKKVAIKAASIYGHFPNKEALWSAVLDHVHDLYLLYFKRLKQAISQAQNYEEVVRCMFVELKEVVHIFTYYGFSLILTEQFRDEKAYEIYSEVFLRFSIEFIQNEFDLCVEKNWAMPFDTKTVATFFMHSVLNAILLRAHGDMHRTLPYDVDTMFDELEAFILKTGKPDAPVLSGGR